MIKGEVIGTLKTIGTLAITLRGDSSGAQAREDVSNMASGLGNLALGAVAFDGGQSLNMSKKLASDFRYLEFDVLKAKW